MSGPGRNRPAPRTLAWLACLLLSGGCATISLREAMGRVQRHYNVLFREIERDQNFATRDAARDLQRALDDPAVRERAPDAADPEFQDLLRQARAAVDEVRKGAEHFDNEALVKARGEVSARCQACHERFRWKPE